MLSYYPSYIASGILCPMTWTKYTYTYIQSQSQRTLKASFRLSKTYQWTIKYQNCIKT